MKPLVRLTWAELLDVHECVSLALRRARTTEERDGIHDVLLILEQVMKASKAKDEDELVKSRSPLFTVIS